MHRHDPATGRRDHTPFLLAGDRIRVELPQVTANARIARILEQVVERAGVTAVAPRAAVEIAGDRLTIEVTDLEQALLRLTPLGEGFGTLDEVFEVLALVQTGKMAPIPIVLVGSAFWNRAVDFSFLVTEGMIDPADAELFTVVDTAVDAVSVLERFYGGTPPP